MADKLIQPRTLRGFRDFLPESMIPREWLIEKCKAVYRSFGFAPIDSPALELFEILTGKGSDETDRQMYHFVDQGDRHVGMRFDLTVPLARFVAQHHAELAIPFKRYHIATVWRGESPQAGRYREFMQCDFDTIGTIALASDVETGLVIFELLNAIGIPDFQIRINNRKVLNGFLKKLGLLEQSTTVLRAIDKLPKVGAKLVEDELTATANLNTEQTRAVLQFATIKGSNLEVLQTLDQLGAGDELAEAGCFELRELFRVYSELGIAEENLRVDPSIARGLDYYTGTIFETFLTAKPEIGSVCSGGRYDDLAGMFTKEKLPGIGASLGLDRLLTAMEMLGLVQPRKSTAAVMVANFSAEGLVTYFRLAHQLRRAGIAVEVYPETKKLGVQFKFADRQGFRAVLVAGPDEIAKNEVQIKWLLEGTQVAVSTTDSGQAMIAQIREKLNSSQGVVE